MKFKDFYKVLGVSENASGDEIKRAYRQKARKYHPDVSSESGAEERFKEINQAYETLKDDKRRAEYDQLKRYGFKDGDDMNHSSHGGAGGFDPGAFGNADFSDLFESIFGQSGFNSGGFNQSEFGRGGFNGARGRGQQRRWPQQGDDISLTVRVSLENAYRGGKTRISIPGRNSRKLNVNIPAGVTDGQQLRLQGQGNPGVNGGPPGDLLLTIALKPHPHFRADGSNILLSVPVTPYEAAAGVRLNVPTLSGKVALTIPPNTQSGTKMRLRGKGLPGSGDLIVEVHIQLPPEVSSDALEMLKQFDQVSSGNVREHFENVEMS